MGRDTKNKLIHNGRFVEIQGHKIHLYVSGDKHNQTLVFMSGSATVAPIYDFKNLYEKLTDKYNIVVIEKFGYGYSDIFETSCDIDTLVSIDRTALENAQIKKPYILLPHSMSGLEAIRWKQKFPDEIEAIIGIDMATPFAYEKWTEKKIQKTVNMFSFVKKLKLHFIPKAYPLSNRSLLPNEIKQQKLLMKRNAFNVCYINEAKAVLQNARIVSNSDYIRCPMILFSSNGKQIDKYWVENQHKFADMMNAKLICYNCGHYIHYYKSLEMANEIKNFTNSF